MLDGGLMDEQLKKKIGRLMDGWMDGWKNE